MMQLENGTEIGVDVGGTFTDVVCRRSGEALIIVKVPTTPDDLTIAVLHSLDQLADRASIRPGDITRFVHGTTVATNAVLERKGAKVGLLTTAGFKDVLEIGRQIRRAVYSVILEPETPGFLVPGGRRKEVDERIAADGKIITPLDEASVVRALDELVADGVTAVAICFLFSFLNPNHEFRAREIARRAYPNLYVSVSCEVDPAFREYERTLVTAFDAFIGPVVQGYLEHLEKRLSDAGVRAPLQIMQSRGGVSSASVAIRRPVRLFLSGPAAGVIGGRIVGQNSCISDVITIDIGGTSCDIALISQGKPMLRSEGVIDGFPVRVPMVDVNAIGSGGGSIAWLDSAAGLRVGPQSAGADPGPACYGRGGEEATVTDASLVLGYINPEYFAGGVLRLHPEKARAAIAKNVANPLNMTIEKAALGIHSVLNAQMAEGIRLVSIRQGLDPRKFALVSLGGAGPLHATALARELSISTIVVPKHPGVLSAVGLLVAQTEYEIFTAFPVPLKGLALQDVRRTLDDLDRQCSELMRAEGTDPSAVRILHSADMCYIGQAHHLEIPLHLDARDPLSQLYEDFLAAHDSVFGHSTRSPACIVNVRAVHQAGGLEALDEPPRNVERDTALKGTRRVMLPESDDYIEAAIFKREALMVGDEIEGPAIVEQLDTTTLIEPGWRASVEVSGNLLLTRN